MEDRLMLLQTNSYIVPKERRAEHARLIRRFRQALARIGLDQFEVYEQVGANWSPGGANGRYVQIMRFRDRQHQQSVQAAERQDHGAQHIIAEFCELINFPYQQQHGYFATGFYTSVLPVGPRQAPGMEAHQPAERAHMEHHEAHAQEAVAEEEAEVSPEEEAHVAEEVFSEEPADQVEEESAVEAVAEAEPSAELPEADAAEEAALADEVAHESPAQLAHEEQVADAFLDAQGDTNEPSEELGGHAPVQAEDEALRETEAEIAAPDAPLTTAPAEAANEEELLLNDGALRQEPEAFAQAPGENAALAEPELAAGELAGLDDFGLAFDDEALAEATADIPSADLGSADLSEFESATAEDELAGAAPVETSPEVSSEAPLSDIGQTVPEIAALTPPPIPTEEPHPGELGELGLDFDDAAIAEATSAEHQEALGTADLGLHFDDELPAAEESESAPAGEPAAEAPAEISPPEAENIELAAEETTAVEEVPAEVSADVAPEVSPLEPLAEELPGGQQPPAIPVAEDNLDDLLFADEAPAAEETPVEVTAAESAAAEASIPDVDASPFAESTSVAEAIHFADSTPTLEMLSPEQEALFAESVPALASEPQASAAGTTAEVHSPVAESAPAETAPPAFETPVEEFNLDEGLIFDDDDLILDEASAELVAPEPAHASGENGQADDHGAIDELPAIEELHDEKTHESLPHETHAAHDSGFDELLGDSAVMSSAPASDNGKNGSSYAGHEAAAKSPDAPEEIDADLLEFDAFLRQLDEEHGHKSK
jgi:hypothetical protein